MKKFITILALLTVTIGGLSGCGMQREDAGTVVGGVAGGVLGSAVTGGSTAGTVVGAVGGAVVGRSIASDR